MVELQVTLKGEGPVDPLAMEKVMRRVQVVLLEGEKKNFDEEGPGWAELAPSTIRRRRRGRASFGGTRVRKLRDSGQMHASVTALTHPQGIREATNDRAVVGTRMKRGHYHQDGTPTIPARPFMRIRTEDVQRIEEMVADGFMGTLGRSA